MGRPGAYLTVDRETEPLRPVAWLCVGPVEGLPGTPDLERHGWRNRMPLEEVLHEERYTRRPGR